MAENPQSLKSPRAKSMELDELSQSGIRRIADYSPYLDQLAGLAQQMGLRQRSNLMHVESALRNHWSLGQNSILCWTPLDQSILILVVPHYAIADYTSPTEGDNTTTSVIAVHNRTDFRGQAIVNLANAESFTPPGS